MTVSRFTAAGGALLLTLVGSPTTADVISDWSTAVAPPPPELKEVTVDPFDHGVAVSRYHERQLRRAPALRRGGAEHQTAA